MLLMLLMPQEEKTVVLQTDVRESIRTSLKLQAVRLGTTMSLLTEEILDEGLKKLEQQEVRK
ncbi:hypothetical protein [Nostoc sp.]|uniref:hypothetical protein n=1 Tax=Nostoc sp. TaxID=1180 RepID=UPI002FF73E92